MLDVLAARTATARLRSRRRPRAWAAARTSKRGRTAAGGRAGARHGPGRRPPPARLPAAPMLDVLAARMATTRLRGRLPKFIQPTPMGVGRRAHVVHTPPPCSTSWLRGRQGPTKPPLRCRAPHTAPARPLRAPPPSGSRSGRSPRRSGFRPGAANARRPRPGPRDPARGPPGEVEPPLCRPGASCRSRPAAPPLRLPTGEIPPPLRLPPRDLIVHVTMRDAQRNPAATRLRPLCPRWPRASTAAPALIAPTAVPLPRRSCVRRDVSAWRIWTNTPPRHCPRQFTRRAPQPGCHTSPAAPPPAASCVYRRSRFDRADGGPPPAALLRPPRRVRVADLDQHAAASLSPSLCATHNATRLPRVSDRSTPVGLARLPPLPLRSRRWRSPSRGAPASAATCPRGGSGPTRRRVIVSVTMCDAQRNPAATRLRPLRARQPRASAAAPASIAPTVVPPSAAGWARHLRLFVLRTKFMARAEP